MKLRWTSKALDDVARLYDFLHPLNPQAADKFVQGMAHAAGRLMERPRIGERLDQFPPNEIRRIIVSNYEMRYEIRDGAIYVLRLWHTRESR